MAEFLQNTLALIVTLGILVTIHEWGHFRVARWCGVRVLRFSVGFGRPLLSWHDRQGTEFVIAALPLGGYVKMLDEREAPVAEDQLDAAFNRKPVGQRMAIAAAGPAMNFVFALLAYWLMAVVGTTVIIPKIGSGAEQSPAAMAEVPVGGIIAAVDGEPVNGWQDINLALIDRLGDSGSIALQVQPQPGMAVQNYALPVTDWLRGAGEPDLIGSLGIGVWRPATEARIASVLPDSAAERAGLRAGDRIVAADGVPIEDWQALVETVRGSPGATLAIEILHPDGSRSQRDLIPAIREQDGRSEGFIGVSVTTPEWPQSMLREVRSGPLEAIPAAIGQTWDMTLTLLGSLQKLVVGIVSLENLGGPITIAKAAGATASIGLDTFLAFLAQLSVMLAVLNLLPIPMLDGGHLLYYSIEWLRGRPLSEAAQMMGVRIGMAMLGAVMFIALFNDFSRL